MSFAIRPSPTEQLSLLEACADELEPRPEPSPEPESRPEQSRRFEPLPPLRPPTPPPATVVLAEADAPTPVQPPPLRPELLHPAVWLGHQLGRHAQATSPSGFAELDDELPAGGWPHRVLTELLLPHAGLGEMRLLSPCLAALQQAGKLLMLFDPPETLSGWALCELGLDVQQLLVIQTRARVLPGADSLWALEQALKSGHAGAVLAWLPPRLRAERLRRLQLAAHVHDGPAFVFRELAAAQRPTAAPLRLALKPAGADVLALQVLKRRGPPLETPLRVGLPPVLSETARERALACAHERAQGLTRATFVDLG